MIRKILVTILLLSQVLLADTWLGGGGGIFIPLKAGNYSYDPGIGWKISVQHNFSPQNTDYLGFIISVSGYQNEINDFYFDNSSYRMKQNDIQLGLVYNVFRYQDHHFELSVGYISKSIETDFNQLNISQNDSGFYLGFGDKFVLNEFFLFEGIFSWQFYETETNWGTVALNGPKIELLIWMKVLSSE